MDKNLYQLCEYNRIILLEVDRIIHNIHTQNYDVAFRKAAKLTDYLNNFINLLSLNRESFINLGVGFDINTLYDYLNEILKAQKIKDYVLVADLYEVKLAPLFLQLQEAILMQEDVCFDQKRYFRNSEILAKNDSTLNKLLKTVPNLEFISAQGYSIEPSSGGDMTIAYGMGDKRYLHSNTNVWREASALARSWYNYDKAGYIVYGLGLGYNINELYLMDECLDIEVYESNIEIIRLACAYSEHLTIFSHDNIKLIYDPDFSKLSRRIEQLEDNIDFVIHYPSLEMINNQKIKEKFENYFIQQNSAKNQLTILNRNFSKNTQYYDGLLDELMESFSGRDLFIVAAGPSLDKNFRMLKEVRDKGIILATGTVFKKLMKEGIRPDYVLVTDPNDRVYKQIPGYETCDVPMLFLSTAYYGFAANYQGKKYMVCQKDYPKAEELARQKGIQLYRTGGSVSTTALDIGITLGCRRIIFLGLDLAYTDNLAHASDTSRRRVAETADMRQVEDIHGNMVNTGRNLDIFRIWIENRIRDVKGIEFIDATEGGAKIHGMRIAPLSEVLEEL